VMYREVRRTLTEQRWALRRWLYKIVGDDLDVRAKVFKWTGRNTYFALCESEFISFGGG
jgi:hypothetical protein